MQEHMDSVLFWTADLGSIASCSRAAISPSKYICSSTLGVIVFEEKCETPNN